jgi:hypothetical protein
MSYAIINGRVLQLISIFMGANMTKIKTANLVIRRGRLVYDEHGPLIVYERILPPLAGCERAVSASVIRNASMQELGAAHALQEAALARRMRARRPTKPPGRDI